MNGKKRSVIEKITLNTATFHGEVIEPTYVNFFYGKNGVGKSTVADAVGRGDNVVWREGTGASDFEIAVFNRDFINRNFETYDNLQGVFTISEPNIKAKKLAEEKTAEKESLDRLAETYTRERDEKISDAEKSEADFRRLCWDKTRDIYSEFPEALKGYGRKALFAEAVKAVKTPKAHNLTELGELYRTVCDSNARAYGLFSKIVSPTTYGRLPGNELMGKPVISGGETPFANFIKALNASDWVRRGYGGFSGKSGGKCPYCQQKLPDNFDNEIAACFNERYRQDISEISRFKTVYERETTLIADRLRANLNDPPPTLDLTEYRNRLSLFEANVKINTQRIAEKIKEPATAVSLEDTDSVLIEIGRIIDSANAKIRANNAIVAASREKKRECAAAVWEHIAFMLKEDVAAYRERTGQLEKEAGVLNARAAETRRKSRELSARIAELNRHTVNTKAAADEINAVLLGSGFYGFRLREKTGMPDVYEVVRDNGAVAETLSEGEREFVAFLYFCCTLKGSRDGTAKDKIAVIDDPVSDMDPSSMSVAAELVRDMADDCTGGTANTDSRRTFGRVKQMFVFTHDPRFFGEITRRQTKNYAGASFYLIRKKSNVSTIGAPQTRPNPDIPGEAENASPVSDPYSAMWSELEELNTPTPLIGVMRRILRAYFLQICGYGSDELKEAVLDNAEVFADRRESGGGEPNGEMLEIASLLLSGRGRGIYNRRLRRRIAL